MWPKNEKQIHSSVIADTCQCFQGSLWCIAHKITSLSNRYEMNYVIQFDWFTQIGENHGSLIRPHEWWIDRPTVVSSVIIHSYQLLGNMGVQHLLGLALNYISVNLFGGNVNWGVCWASGDVLTRVNSVAKNSNFEIEGW